MENNYDIDPSLRIIYLISMRIAEYIPVKILLSIAILFHILFNGVHFIHIIITFNAKLLLQYAPMLFITCQGIVGGLVNILLQPEITYYRNRQYSKSWKHCKSQKTIQKNKQGCLTTLRVIFCNIFIVMICFVMHGYNIVKGIDDYYPLMIVKEHCSSKQFVHIFTLFYALTLPLLTFGMISNTFVLVYFSRKNQLQLSMINAVLLELSSEKRNDSALIENIDYQKMISNTLKVCIKHHSWVIKYQKESNGVVELPITILILFATAFHISILFNLVVVGDIDNTNIAMLMTLLAGATNLGLFIYCGQSLQDECWNVRKQLTELSWTTWNIQNQKLLLMFLTNSERPAFLGVDGLLIFQAIVSTIMFFRQVVPKI